MTRTLPALFVAVTVTLGTAGCGTTGGLPTNARRLLEVEPDAQMDPAAMARVYASASFEFGWQEGGGGPEMLGHYHTVRMSADGRGTYTAPFTNGRQLRLRQTSFALPSAKVLQLRRLLKKVDVLSLPKAYRGNMADGMQVRVQVRSAGVDKRILCTDEYFPPEVRKLADFVHAEVTGPLEAQVAVGRVLGDDEIVYELFETPY